MATNTNGEEGGLFWDAGINLESYFAGLQKMAVEADRTGGKVSGSFTGIDKAVVGISGSLKAARNEFANLGKADINFSGANQELIKTIQNLEGLESAIAEVRNNRITLQDNFKEGQINAANYRAELAKLNEAEQLLRSSVEATKASQKSYDAQLQQTQNKLKNEAAQLEKIRVLYNEIANQPKKSEAFKTAASEIKRLESSIAKGKDAETKILEERTIAAAKLEEQLKALNKVKVDKVDLKTAYGEGARYIEQYNNAIAELNIKERQLTAAHQKEVAALRENQIFLQAVNQALGERQKKVQELTQAYARLSQSDQASPEIGGKLQADLQEATNSVDTIRKALISLNALPAIQVDINTGEETQRILSAIADIKATISSVPPLEVDVQGIGELEQAILRTTELKAKLAALPENEQLDINIGGKIQEELTSLDSRISRIVEKILGVPEFSMGNLDNEIAKFKQLETLLETLTDEEIKAGKGERLFAELDQAESKINLLKKAISTVPELTLGNVKDKVNDILRLKGAVDGIKSPDALTIGKTLQTEVAAGIKALQDLKESVKDVPGINISGIDKSIADLTKLQKHIQELNQVQNNKLTLTNNFDKTTGDVQAYNAELAQLTDRENELTQAVINSTAALQKNANAQQAGIAELNKKQAKLESLKLSYAQLSDAEKQTGQGLAISKEIDTLKNDVDALTSSLQKMQVGNISTTGISKLKNEFRDLLDIQRRLSQVELDKINLETNFKVGAIDANAYADALEKLEKEENDLIASLVKASTEIKKNDDFQKAGAAIIADKTKELAKLTAAYQNLPQTTKLNPEVGGGMKAEMDALEREITGINNLLKNTNSTDAFDKSVVGAEQFRKTIQSLKIEMASYQAIVEKSTDPAIISRYNAEISRLGKEIKEIKNAGREGFDALGRPMKEQLSILGRLERAAALYRSAIANATNTDNITKYNRKLQDTETQIKKLQNAGKQGFDEFGNSVKQTTGLTDMLGNSFKGMAITLAGMFGVFELIQFAKELFGLQVKAEGVEQAFARLGNPQLLEELRRQTKGTVSDLTLMQTAVNANNFKIPMDVLGKGLAFAQKRAKDTGKEVDHLVESLVDGLGRKSALKIDNLGISLVDIQKEMKKTGDFATAVGNLMEREMARSGEAIDGMAERTNRASAIWENFKKFLSRGFNPGAINTDNVTKYTEVLLKEIGKLDKATGKFTLDLVDEGELKRELALLQEQQKAINETLSGKRDLQPGVGLRQLRDQKAANDNIILSIIKRVDTLKEEERIAKNLLSVAEMQAKVEKLRSDATNIIPVSQLDKNERQKLLKEADELQKQVDAILGKEDKNSEALANRIRQSLEQRLALIQKIAEIDTKYNAANLTPDELALQQVRDEFKKIADEVGKFNRDPKNKVKISTEGLEKTREKALADLTYKQETERLGIELERQKQIFAEYEKFKTSVGQTEADKRFSFDKKAFDDYGAYIEAEIAKIDTSVPLDAVTQQRLDMLKKQSQDYWQSERDLRTQALQEALIATASYEQQRKAIVDRYAKQEKELRASNPENVDARLRELKRQQDLEIDALKDATFQKTAIYERLSKDVVRISQEQARTQIIAIKEVLEASTDMAPELRAKLEKELATLEVRINIGVNKAYINELKQQKKELLDSLKLDIQSTAEKEKQLEKLKQINQQLAQAPAEQFAQIGEYADGIATSLAAAANAMGQFDEAAGKAVGEVANLVGSIGQLAKGIASGDPFAILTGGIDTLFQLYNLIDNTEEKAARNEERRRQALEATNRELEAMNRLLEVGARAIGEALGLDKIAAFRNQITLLTSDIGKVIDKINNVELYTDAVRGIREYEAALKKLNDTIGGMGRPDRDGTPNNLPIANLKSIDQVIEANKEAINSLYEMMESGRLTGNIEELKELLSQYQDLETQLDQYRNQIREILTGTTFSSLVDSIAAGFDQGFASAEDRAHFFADKFQSLMRNAILQSFKMSDLEKPLMDFYAKFAEMSESGGQLDDTEIDELEALYNEIIANAEKKFEDLQKIAKINFADSANDPNSLAGAFSRASQESIDLLAGQMGGLRIAQLEHLAVAKDILAAIRILDSGVTIQAPDVNVAPTQTMLQVDLNGLLTPLAAIQANTLDTNAILRAGLPVNLINGLNFEPGTTTLDFTGLETISKEQLAVARQQANYGQETMRVLNDSIRYQQETAENTRQTVSAVLNQTKTLDSRLATIERRIGENNRSLGSNGMG